MLRWSIVFLALFVYVQGRAVNISNTWVLPEEGFPVFYRYFRDRISWYEADAVCQFHHANLVTVDTTAQYDAVRAYLKELDITSAVWVGLIRSNPDGDFTWTDYRGLSGEGYWSSAPDARTAPLCAAANPSADYRWEARACGGPTVASFICELPVPQWALGNEGCMVRALPALTILYLPESAAVQLTADCGLAGVKRVQCTGNVKREDLLKQLACVEEEEISSTPTMSGLTTTWAVTTDLFTDEDATKEITVDDNITTEHEDDINQSTVVSSTSISEVINNNLKPYLLNAHRASDIVISKNVDMDVTHDNNLQSNVVPEVPTKLKFDEMLEKSEDEKHMQHKMIHEEIARFGNLDKIFTQPTDHFVPPLVMAKAKLSDDMTVLSLAEKHAQQLAEQQFTKHNLHSQYENVPSTINEKNTVKPLTKTIEVIPKSDKKKTDEKKEIHKNIVPKKYSEKLNDPKSKLLKSPEIKFYDFQKTTERARIQTEVTVNSAYVTTSTVKPVTRDTITDIDEDHMIDLSVFLKDEPMDTNKQITATNFTGDISDLETIKDLPIRNINQTLSEKDVVKMENTSATVTDTEPTQDYYTSTEKIVMDHEIVKIIILSENSSTVKPTEIEVTTMMPHFLADNTQNITSLDNTTLNNTEKDSIHSTTNNVVNVTEPPTETTTVNTKITSTEIPITVTNINDITTRTATTDNYNFTTTTILPISSSTTSSAAINETSSKEADPHDEFHEDPMNSTETEIDDFQSPLLSAANEPIHRPNRSRRLQQQNLIKFNPFRILG